MPVKKSGGRPRLGEGCSTCTVLERARAYLDAQVVPAPHVRPLGDVALIREMVTELELFDQASLDMCPACHWRTLLPEMGCLHCNPAAAFAGLPLDDRIEFLLAHTRRDPAEMATLLRILIDRARDEGLVVMRAGRVWAVPTGPRARKSRARPGAKETP